MAIKVIADFGLTRLLLNHLLYPRGLQARGMENVQRTKQMDLRIAQDIRVCETIVRALAFRSAQPPVHYVVPMPWAGIPPQP